MKRLKKKAGELESKEMLVFISLLLDMASRAQDVIGIPYGLILDAKRKSNFDFFVHQYIYLVIKNKNLYEVYLEPKKTDGRRAYVTRTTYNLVDKLMKKKNAKESDIMYALGEKKDNPYEMWTMKVNKFLKKNADGNITTHDFRKTAATNLYKQTNDIVMV